MPRVSGHFRLRARHPLRVRVTLRRQHERSSREVEGTTENIGFGGAFVAATPPLPPGTRLEVSLASPTTWEPLRLGGVVRWVRDARGELSAGMGVMFDPLSAEHAVALHRLFGAHGFDDE